MFIAFLRYPLRQTISKLFFLVCSVSFLICFAWLQFVNRWQVKSTSLVEEALENGAQNPKYADVYRKTERLPTDTKFLLLWTSKEYAPFTNFEEGQWSFISRNCSFTNCYVTDNREFFHDVTKFDAIAFNGRNIEDLRSDLPTSRSQRQKYIFFNTESADNYPVCAEEFEGFFNLTATYRLDSDIVSPYILIRDSEGTVVGPRIDMKWNNNRNKLSEDEELMNKLQSKTKAAAWFVSNCKSLSGRENFVYKLQKALKLYDLTVDIYGSCGPCTCPRDQREDCEALLENDYFFYLALENSFDEDYVTEKLLTALQHDTVPVVYGGANYSRFLPPGSYLDGQNRTPHDIASSMAQLIWSSSIYRQYFNWRNQYYYYDPSSVENVCAVCEALNNKKIMETYSVYEKFRKWWNPSYEERCNKWLSIDFW